MSLIEAVPASSTYCLPLIYAIMMEPLVALNRPSLDPIILTQVVFQLT